VPQLGTGTLLFPINQSEVLPATLRHDRSGKFASDPAAQWTGALREPTVFAYADNDLIDFRAAVIVDVEASRAVRQAKVGAAHTMPERTAERFGLKPERPAGDSAYGSAEMLRWLVDPQKIEPHVPVMDKSERQDGTFSRSDFTARTGFIGTAPLTRRLELDSPLVWLEGHDVGPRRWRRYGRRHRQLNDRRKVWSSWKIRSEARGGARDLGPDHKGSGQRLAMLSSIGVCWAPE
jgi:hypothetical protein